VHTRTLNKPDAASSEILRTHRDVTVVHILHGAGGGVLRMVDELARVQGKNAIVLLGDRRPIRLASAVAALGKTPYQIRPYLLSQVPLVSGFLPPPLRELRWLDALDPGKTVLHFHNHGVAGVWWRLLACLRRFPAVLTIHGVLPQDVLSLGRIPTIRKQLHHLSLWCAVRYRARVVACSVETKRSAERLYSSLQMTDVSVVHNGIQEDPSMIVEQKGAEHRRRIGVVASFEPVKNIPNTLLALEMYCKDRSRAEGIVCGNPNSTSDALSSKYPSLTFYGSIPNAGRALIPSLDLLVIASLSEGMPMVALEALSAGVPIVATRAGGLASLIELGCAAPIESNTADAILKAIVGLDADDLTRMSARARLVFNQHFTASRMAEGYDLVYQCAIVGSVSA
jgi:glycosyltransferase involved in cell wall biosynthesis